MSTMSVLSFLSLNSPHQVALGFFAISIVVIFELNHTPKPPKIPSPTKKPDEFVDGLELHVTPVSSQTQNSL